MLQMHGHVLEIIGLKCIGLLCSYDVYNLSVIDSCMQMVNVLKISLDQKGLYVHIRL